MCLVLPSPRVCGKDLPTCSTRGVSKQNWGQSLHLESRNRNPSEPRDSCSQSHHMSACHHQCMACCSMHHRQGARCQQWCFRTLQHSECENNTNRVMSTITLTALMAKLNGRQGIPFSDTSSTALGWRRPALIKILGSMVNSSHSVGGVALPISFSIYDPEMSSRGK